MALFSSIARGIFPTLSDIDAIRLFGISFESELRWLKNATPTVESNKSATIGAFGNNGLTPSRVLYGFDFPEVNRTLVSMLALKWLMAEDYETFTCCQSPLTKLRPESFQRLNILLIESCPGPEAIYALLIAIVVNDLGKNDDLATLVKNITGQTFQNHDNVMYAAAKEHLFPSLEAIDPSLQSDLLLGFEFGSKLNIAQFAQAESVTVSLKNALIMSGRDRAFAIKFMEVILDVAGAGGHVDARCAAQMTEPVFQTYLVVHEALLDIIGRRISPREGYDRVLFARERLLQEAGFKKSLSINVPADRALVRLLTMGRVAEKESADRFARAFENLAAETRQSLVDALNVDGIDGETAIFYSYAPALISEALKNTEEHGTEHQVLVLGALMRFLARIYDREKLNPRRKSDVTEINLSFAQEIVKSDEFSRDPRLLDDLSIPSQV